MDLDETGHISALDERERTAGGNGQLSEEVGAAGAEPPVSAVDEVSPDGIDEIEERLDDVERALTRLDDGTYGQCETCGAPIADALIEADPLLVSHPACARDDRPTD